MPSTPRGELVKRMRETDSQFRKGSKLRQIKFIERAGVSLRDTLVSSNPWGEMKCGRKECFVCKSENGGIAKCMRESVLYSIRCEECKAKERTVEYWGETGRDCYSRGEEHVKGCRERCEDNPMWKHIYESHGGEGGEELFSMRMEAGFKKPLARQIREGVEIESSRGELMNSKSEWNNSRIPRIVIETGEKLTEDEESGLGKKSEKEKTVRLREERGYQVKNRNPKRKEIETGGGEDDIVTKKQRIMSVSDDVRGAVRELVLNQEVIQDKKEKREKIKSEKCEIMTKEEKREKWENNSSEKSSEPKKIPTKKVSQGIQKISQIFEKSEKNEIINTPEKKENKVRLMCNSFEEMMQNTGARRKVYEVKKKRKRSVEKVDRENPMRKSMENWVVKEKTEKHEVLEFRESRPNSKVVNHDKLEMIGGAKVKTWSSQPEIRIQSSILKKKSRS